ncbi:MAG: VWA domain-containing protein [Acidobacteriota bacterium]|jgi:Ca-activated chloride channel family protein
MPRPINRFRPRLEAALPFLAFLVLITISDYLKNTYAINAYVIHSYPTSVQNADFNQNLLSAQESGREQGGYKVGVKVDLVMMYTSVFDKNSHFISDLKKEDFNLYEDGVLQEIAYFSQEDTPISLGIILDLSGSMMGRIEQVHRAARAFIEASNPSDEVFLIGFNDEVELLQPFTNDIDEISDALENAIVTGDTALYDAIYLGVQEAHKGKKSKKAVVVISDGVDRMSAYSLNELVSFVQESDVQIYSIFLNELPEEGFFGRWRKTEGERALDALKRISQESGGKAHIPSQDNTIYNIVAEIASELRSQYSIGYFSSNDKSDGSWRRVVIKLDSDTISNPQLRYRRGYYAPKDPTE